MTIDLNTVGLQTEVEGNEHSPPLTHDEELELEARRQEEADEYKMGRDKDAYRVAFNVLFENLNRDIKKRLRQFDASTTGNFCREDSEYKDALDAVMVAMICAGHEYKTNEWRMPFLQRLAIEAVGTMQLK
jgi:hypothetical protein